MNFSGFDFDTETQNTLASLESNGKIPHAVIIECLNDDKALECARFLTMYLVCQGDNKPCDVCKQCHQAKNMAHPDVSYPNPDNKSKTLSVQQMKDMILDASIVPNQSDYKAYVLKNADVSLRAEAQNVILKTLEEPPKNVHFFLLCKNSGSFLDTIRSRCVTIRIKDKRQIDEKLVSSAKELAESLISSKEYNLLKALLVLEKKETSNDVLDAVVMILRDSMAYLVGADAEFDAELAQRLATRLTKKQIIEMIELSRKAQLKIIQNVNTQLLMTWLCSEYRRILWQK